MDGWRLNRSPPDRIPVQREGYNTVDPWGVVLSDLPS